MRNDGKTAEDAWLRYMQANPNTVVERFWDQRDLRGRNGGRAVGDFPKPADFLVYHKGHLHYAEVKSVQSATSFPFKDIRPKQKSTALRMAAAGAGTHFLFYIFSYALGQWFIMSADQLAKATKSSIKFTELTPWQK